jgi:hypothetical protein
LAYLNCNLFDKPKIDYNISDGSISNGFLVGVFFYSFFGIYGMTIPATGSEGLSAAYGERSTTKVC